MKARQKARICNDTFGLGERDKAKDNPSLAASSKSMPCRERPGVNSSKTTTPNANPSLTPLILFAARRSPRRKGWRRLRARHGYALRVLLADDHQAMLALTADALASECLVVGRAGDGCQLLAEAGRLHPDFIMLDITMRGLTASKRRANSSAGRGLPASFLTVHEDADYARAALDAGGLGYIAYSIRMILDHPRGNAALDDD
jgi:CheY-like chemotaxis protein